MKTPLDTALETLFSPFTFRSLTLRNRLVMAPMTRRQSPGGMPNAENADYYQQRADGGMGLIISEGTLIDEPHAANDELIPRMLPATVPAWRAITQRVHDAGCAMFCQLWHQGPQTQPGLGVEEILANYQVVVRRVTQRDLTLIENAFAAAAEQARAAGFDGLELHGAHGYLLHAFLKHAQRPVASDSPRTGLECVVEIVRRVRAAVGPDFPVALRFSQWEVGDYDNQSFRSPEELQSMLLPLRDAGVDFFHASTRRLWLSAFCEGTQTLAGWTRELTHRPTIAVGGLGLKTAELTGTGQASLIATAARLTRQECDLIAIGRAVLTDANWPNKVHALRFADIIEHRH